MRQNIGFFDKLGAGEITTRITADTNLVQDGISEKVGLTLAAVATFITAFIIGKKYPNADGLTSLIHSKRLRKVLEVNSDLVFYHFCYRHRYGRWI